MCAQDPGLEQRNPKVFFSGLQESQRRSRMDLQVPIPPNNNGQPEQGVPEIVKVAQMNLSAESIVCQKNAEESSQECRDLRQPLGLAECHG